MAFGLSAKTLNANVPIIHRHLINTTHQPVTSTLQYQWSLQK
jgi:hypothetical protein